MSEGRDVISDCAVTSEKQKGTSKEQDGSVKEKSQEIAAKFVEIFDINIPLNDIYFTNFQEDTYSEPRSVAFGEKSCLLYTIDFGIFYSRWEVKILVLQYDNNMKEILKIDIASSDCQSDLTKELESCFKTLRRRRNLTLLMKTLISFTKALESRRLIVLTVLSKYSDLIKVEPNTDGGILLHYANSDNLKLSLFWSITVNSLCKVRDVIHMYQSNLDRHHKDEMQSVIKSLSHPELHFITKYHLWKHLVSKLSIKKNLKRKYSRPAFSPSNNFSSPVPSSSTGLAWASTQSTPMDRFLQNLSAGAFRYMLPSVRAMPSQASLSAQNQYGVSHFPQSRFPVLNSSLFNVTGSLHRQNIFPSGYHTRNIPPILSSSQSLISPTSPPSSRIQIPTSTVPEDLSMRGLESPRRASQSQKNKLYQKYVKYKSQKYFKPFNRSNSIQNLERSQPSRSRYPTKRRGFEKSRIVEPDVEIIDISNPSSSSDISGTKERDKQTANDEDAKQTANNEDVNSIVSNEAHKNNGESSVPRNADVHNIHNSSFNNNDEAVKSVDSAEDGLESSLCANLIQDRIDKPPLLPVDGEVVKRTKKFNPFSLKFKDKLNKSTSSLVNHEENQQASDLECVLVLSDNESSINRASEPRDESSKKINKIVYVPD